MENLIKIQSELIATKKQYNKFGKYAYRNAEDIMEAVKPLLLKYNALLYITDEIINISDRFYVKATATIHINDKTISVSALAREEEIKKGMDGSQITGSASSYARKYALNGLFLIDDNKDADFTNKHDDNSATKIKEIDNINTVEELKCFWDTNKELHKNKVFTKTIAQRKKEIENSPINA